MAGELVGEEVFKARVVVVEVEELMRHTIGKLNGRQEMAELHQILGVVLLGHLLLIKGLQTSHRLRFFPL